MIWTTSTKQELKALSKRFSDVETECATIRTALDKNNETLVKYLVEIHRLRSQIHADREQYTKDVTHERLRFDSLLNQYINHMSPKPKAILPANVTTMQEQIPDVFNLLEELPLGDKDGYSTEELTLDYEQKVTE